MYKEQLIVYHEEGLQPPAPYQYWEINKYLFVYKIKHVKG